MKKNENKFELELEITTPTGYKGENERLIVKIPVTFYFKDDELHFIDVNLERKVVIEDGQISTGGCYIDFANMKPVDGS